MRSFKNFSGICQIDMEHFQTLDKTSFSWARHDLFWVRLEGEARGKWKEDYFRDHYLEGMKILSKNQIGIVPVLGYTLSWASKKEGPEALDHFFLNGNEYCFTMQPDGSCVLEQFFQKTIKGEAVKKSNSKKLSPEKMASRWLREQNIPDWENYVRKMVQTLKKPPYNVQYFQVWNEAWPTSGFWRGNMEVYVNRIHFPAAKIIREEGCKVVYGGWPCGAPIKFMLEFFDKYKIWDSVDIIDLHYFPLAAMDYVVKEMKKRNLNKGLWQTEFGFTTSQNFIGNTYPRILYWALDNDWNFADKYKCFYFSHNNPNDPKAYGFGRNLYEDGKPKGNAHSLSTLARLLDGGELNIFKDMSSEPKLSFQIDERQSSLEAFQVADKIICALHLLPNNNAKIFVDWEGDGDTIHLDHEDVAVKVFLTKILPEKISKITRVSMTGYREDISALLKKNGSGSEISVYIRDPKQAKNEYIDMPENELPQVFYLEIELK